MVSYKKEKWIFELDFLCRFSEIKSILKSTLVTIIDRKDYISYDFMTFFALMSLVSLANHCILIFYFEDVDVARAFLNFYFT